MSRIFISGSSYGLGPMVAQLLVEQSHCIGMRARYKQRAETARRKPPADGIALLSINSARIPIEGGRYE
jgi:NADP-dependent 3-hydroxy acid dehydrogenase YdfG